MRKCLTIFFLLSVLLLSFNMVNAQPPFQQSSTELGITLEAPIIEYHPLNQTYEFHVHAHNSTDGLILTNETTNCTIHIYRPSDGEHVVEDIMGFNPENNIDFEYEAGAGNFSEIGQYAVVFYCEVEDEIGGFFEYGFDVSPNGIQLTLWDSLVRMFLILFFIGLLAGTYYVVSKTNFKTWNNSIMKKYENRNFVKMVLSAILYNIMKNTYMLYYLIGFPIIMILADITYTYNISGLILIVNAILLIYTIGILIVGVVFLSYVQEWASKLLDTAKDLDWGIGGKE